MPTPLPKWATDLIAVYKSDASNQFLINGNVYDRLVFPGNPATTNTMGTLDDFFLQSLLGPFEVVLVYDVGNGLRCVKGDQYFDVKDEDLPQAPKAAVETITQYLRYVGNNNLLNRLDRHVAIIIKDAQLVAGSAPAYTFDANATASLIRDWSSSSEFTQHGFATFLITENIADLHPLLVNNDRAARVTIPLPQAPDLTAYFELVWKRFPVALSGFTQTDATASAPRLAEQLVGVNLSELESVLKQKQYAKAVVQQADLVKLKKQIIEKQADGLIEFIESSNTMDDLIGQDMAKKVIRGHIALWKAGDIRAIPMGYLFAAPIGVGKTFLVNCIAGEAGYPVVVVKNFRSKWVGESEAKQEKIKRLIHAIGRCFVFFDEADAVLGKREGSDNDGGMSARIYAGWATEMSNPKNRGVIVWLLASSRADCIEVDLKRPGRIDVIIPLFPCATAAEGFKLLQGLCKREEIDLKDDDLARINSGKDLIPKWLTAGAAEAIAKKIYLQMKTGDVQPADALTATRNVLEDYAPPVAMSKLEEQIRIAANNCTDTDFIPAEFKQFRTD